MNILQAKKLQTRILLGYSVPIIILLLFATIIGVTTKLTDDIGSNRARSNRVLENIEISLFGINKAVRAVRGAALFPTEPAYRESYKKGLEEYDDAVSKVDLEMKDEKQLETWKRAKDEVKRLEPISAEVMNLLKANQVPLAISKIPNLEMTKLDNLKEKLEAREEEIIAEFRNADNTMISITWLTIILGVLVSTLATFILGNMIAAAISREVKKAAVDIRDLLKNNLPIILGK